MGNLERYTNSLIMYNLNLTLSAPSLLFEVIKIQKRVS